MGEVDPAFFQDPEHRPNLSITEAQVIPSIDLSPIHDDSSTDSSKLEELVKQIGNACEDWGFFQVINHGVPLEKREKIEKASREFFSQSLEEKRKIRRDESQASGYYDTEHTKNVRDWKEVFDFTILDPAIIPASPDPDDEDVACWTNQWPQYPPQLREVCEEYTAEVEKLAYSLLELISLSLGLESGKLKGYFKDQTSLVRLNHYPPCPYPHLALGVGHHKDAGALTILSQDEVGGLQVKRRSDGEWIPVKPTPNAYIINVGDIIQVWSNDKYESVEHRVVVNGEKERISIPFFFFPGHYVDVKPLEELTTEENPPKYREYNWGKLLATGNRSNFKKKNVDNIQIYHFKV